MSATNTGGTGTATLSLTVATGSIQVTTLAVASSPVLSRVFSLASTSTSRVVETRLYAVCEIGGVTNNNALFEFNFLSNTYQQLAFSGTQSTDTVSNGRIISSSHPSPWSPLNYSYMTSSWSALGLQVGSVSGHTVVFLNVVSSIGATYWCWFSPTLGVMGHFVTGTSVGPIIGYDIVAANGYIYYSQASGAFRILRRQVLAVPTSTSHIQLGQAELFADNVPYIAGMKFYNGYLYWLDAVSKTIQRTSVDVYSPETVVSGLVSPISGGIDSFDIDPNTGQIWGFDYSTTSSGGQGIKYTPPSSSSTIFTAALGSQVTSEDGPIQTANLAGWRRPAFDSSGNLIVGTTTATSARIKKITFP